MKLHDLPLAEKNMLSALDFAEKSNDLISIGCAYRGLGEILKASEKAEDAAVYFEKLSPLSRKPEIPTVWKK